MPPLQREAILQERKESELHDQRKASHYAKLGINILSIIIYIYIYIINNIQIHNIINMNTSNI